jgi:hypothetical protein
VPSTNPTAAIPAPVIPNPQGSPFLPPPVGGRVFGTVLTSALPGPVVGTTVNLSGGGPEVGIMLELEGITEDDVLELLELEDELELDDELELPAGPLVVVLEIEVEEEGGIDELEGLLDELEVAGRVVVVRAIEVEDELLLELDEELEFG